MKSHVLKLFLVFYILLATCTVMGQEKFNIAAGLGEPELINLGIRYQIGQSQVGLSAGFFPDRHLDYFSVGADYFYHFVGSSTLSSRRTWYGRLSLIQWAVNDEFEKNNYLLLVPRIGKDFHLSPKIGIAVDAGVSIFLSSQRESIKGELPFEIRPNRNTDPSFGFSVFYRL